MTKADIVDRIAEGTGLTKIETKAVVEGFMTTVKQAMEEGRRIELRNFGVFEVEHRAPRTGRNPQTNEPVPIEARYEPVFRPSDKFEASVDEAHKEGETHKEGEAQTNGDAT
ncbi:MAG: HU family DNA-binding protein [Salinibacter sp.]